MRQLLAIEWIKIKKLKATYFILLSFIVLLPVWMIAMNYWFEMMNNNIPIKLFPSTKDLWTFPTVWKFVTWSASWFNYILCILIIILTAQEFSNKTMRQHVIEGLSRKDVILSKIIVLFGFSLFSTTIVFLTGLIFGLSQSEEIDLYHNIHMIFLSFIQSFCYFGFAYVITVLVKKSALSILIFYGYLFVEMILGIFIPTNVYTFFPANTMASLTPMPFLEILTKSKVESGEFILLNAWEIATVGLIYTGLFYTFIYYRLNRKDL